MSDLKELAERIIRGSYTPGIDDVKLIKGIEDQTEVIIQYGIGKLQARNEKFELHKKLYISVNELMCVLGAKGEITTRANEVTAVMDALHDIDDGVYKKPVERTDEILEAIKENGYYDDFIEMMDKDCFIEAATVYAKAEESLINSVTEKVMTNINTPFENIKPCDYDYVITTLQEQLEQKEKQANYFEQSHITVLEELNDLHDENIELKARNEKLERVVEALNRFNPKSKPKEIGGRYLVYLWETLAKYNSKE